MSSYGHNDSGNCSNSVYRAVRERLMKLEFRAFQTCVVLWLGAKRFRHMRSFGRHAARGRKKKGGADFVATVPGLSDVTMAIQLRHWRTPIQRRAVDELRGFMQRSRSPLGMIIANQKFYPAAIQAAEALKGRPVRLVSVAQLASSMVGHGLGVIPTRTGYVIDEAFFRTLDSVSLEPSGIAVPLKTNDDLVAAVGVDKGEPGQFTPELVLLLILAVLIWLIVIGTGR